LANHTILVSRAGTSIPIDDSGAPILGSDGKFSGVVLVFRDVSERQRAEETATRLAAIVEGSDDGVIGITLEGIVTNWNRAAQHMFGYSAEEMIGIPSHGWFRPTIQRETNRFWNRFATAKQ